MATAAAVSGPFTLASLWAVFLVGLAGGFGHCITMCGPISAGGGAFAGVAARSTSGNRAARVAWWQLAYQGGRVLIYTAIGGALGALGSLAAVRGALAPLQQLVWLVAGEAMIFMGLAIAGVPLLARFGRSVEEGYAKATKGWFLRACRALATSGPKAAFPLGMLMGLMPCGFLMSIELYAVGTGSALSGALTMLAFGLGTVPALAGFGVAGGLLGTKARTWLIYGGSAIVIGLGIFYVVRAVGGLAGMPG
jgi:sulfite exporter TauE/SafE